MDRRKFFKKFGIGVLAIPFGVKVAKALKTDTIVLPDTSTRIIGLHSMQTAAISVPQMWMSTASPNGKYLSQYNTTTHKSRYINVHNGKVVRDKALISRLDRGVPYGGEKIG